MYPKDQDGSTSATTGVNPSPSFPKIEESILDYWAKDGTFQASIDQRKNSGAEEFVFYDGPPFANGLPHYGHLLTGYTKDLVPRFKTMRGFRVERRFGWDTHGLPAEVEAERQLGISGRPEIEKYGSEKFNAYCKTSVLKYTEDWRRYVTRQARWVDFDNDYKTLDTNYTESVIWAFQQLYQKGLIYAATPASDFICGTLQLAAGMNLHVFTTGRGTPYGLQACPVVKIATRTELAKRWHDLMDLNAGRVADGDISIEEGGWELFKLLLEVASGQKTWAEHWKLHNALVLFNPAPIT